MRFERGGQPRFELTGHRVVRHRQPERHPIRAEPAPVDIADHAEIAERALEQRIDDRREDFLELRLLGHISPTHVVFTNSLEL